MKYIKHFALLLFVIAMATSCFDDNDDVRRVASSNEIKSFIWKGLNVFYLYKADVPNLANNRFTSDQEYTSFLEGFSTPQSIFDALQSDIDDFSFLVDDYIALEQAFDGITKNNGMEYGLVRYPDNQDLVFGYVRYVLPNTDAEAKGLKRGDIFNTINGTQIAVKNFRELLAPDSYAIGLATYDGTTITPTGNAVSLTKVQYTENPVFIAKTIDVGGSPVGYLMYNSFTADFDAKLNEAFAQFKGDGVTDLILDLRYNGGGSVQSAIDLSSMITGQFKGKVFTTTEWNADRQEQLGATNLFTDKTRDNDAINSLNLTRVYILTSRSSASASELVINGLDPYIQTIKIGDTTRGKFQASITVYDSDNFRRDNANTGHTYAMQPLVLKSINSVGFTDYFNGFAPNVQVDEEFSNLGILGDQNEPLLRAAIDNILGTRSAKSYFTQQLESVGNSKMFSPIYERMYEDFNVDAIE
ncbi:S41 family peptidase [Aquimarina sp. I32.4]|uniref:S41 family peptidase n=1 Tax=Aquimarina sp. I32.4 TaxID=2053903 RepID=UPI000CDEFF9C|nr:S41 family peptidase [Aquimarina sp. I32.4]